MKASTKYPTIEKCTTTYTPPAVYSNVSELPPLSSSNFVELFCGKAKMSQVFQSAGYNTCSIDNRFRKGTCEPTLKIDINKITPGHIPFKKITVLWASPPCTAFSRAAHSKYFNNGKFNKKASPFLKILEKTTQLINILQPDIWYIENPNCRLKRIPFFIDWLKKNNGIHYAITLDSYGFPTTKPTSIFTNNDLMLFRPPSNFGRGYKCIKKFDNLTTVQRQTIPLALCADILYYSNLKLQCL